MLCLRYRVLWGVKVIVFREFSVFSELNIFVLVFYVVIDVMMLFLS